MFQVKAAYQEQLELKASIEQVRAFFSDWRNFADLMPNVERITAEAGGVLRWLIRAEVPVIGSIRQVFTVAPSAADDPRRIEWSPAAGERKNLLRYAATFEEHGDVTRVRIEQRVELRRESPRELHLLAGLAGAGRLSAEVQKSISQMMRVFLQRARARIERGGDG